MEGYFILKEKAEKLGLKDYFDKSDEFQKSIIVLTENDVLEKSQELNKIKSCDFEKVRKNIACWFYKNYYDILMENILNEYEANK